MYIVSYHHDYFYIAKIWLSKFWVLNFKIVHLTQFDPISAVLVSKSKLFYASFRTKEVLKIKQKAFIVLLIECQYFPFFREKSPFFREKGPFLKKRAYFLEKRVHFLEKRVHNNFLLTFWHLCIGQPCHWMYIVSYHHDYFYIAKIWLSKFWVLNFKIVHLTQFDPISAVLVSKSKLFYASFRTKEVLKIKQKAFIVLLIECQYFPFFREKSPFFREKGPFLEKRAYFLEKRVHFLEKRVHNNFLLTFWHLCIGQPCHWMYIVSYHHDYFYIAKIWLSKFWVLNFKIVHLTQFDPISAILVSKSKLFYASFRTKEVLKIKQKAFIVLLIECQYFLGPRYKAKSNYLSLCFGIVTWLDLATCIRGEKRVHFLEERVHFLEKEPIFGEMSPFF